MAAPHAAGVAAGWLGRHPGATPAQAKAELVGAASAVALAGGRALPGTPALLLYSRLGGASGGS